VDKQKHRYLSLGIKICNEPEERARMKMMASLFKQCSLLLAFVDAVVGLLRVGTHRLSIWTFDLELWEERIAISVMCDQSASSLERPFFNRTVCSDVPNAYGSGVDFMYR
jgi:hypothetical protein